MLLVELESLVVLWGRTLKMEEEDARHEEQEPRSYISWTGQLALQRSADKSLDPGGWARTSLTAS